MFGVLNWCLYLVTVKMLAKKKREGYKKYIIPSLAYLLRYALSSYKVRTMVIYKDKLQ